jgi:N-acetylmuramic acid 6-phosphate etherase
MTLDPRITEHRNPRTARIDLATPDEIVALMNAEDRTVADAVASQSDEIASAITIIEGVFSRRRSSLLRRCRHIRPTGDSRCQRMSSDVWH